MIEAIGLDADDTLWENERFFRQTEEAFAELLVDHGGRDEISAHLLQVERANLARYGFGIKGFTLSMIQTALELSDGRVSTRTLARILELGQDMLTHPLHVMDGVAEVLKTLKDRRLFLITKGDLWDQERKLEASGLAGYFEAVEILSDKSPDAYSRVLARHDIEPEAFLMAGNSIKSDILPVLDLGANAAFIPHELTWAVEHAEEPDHPRYHRLDRITELPGLIRTHGSGR